METFPFNLKKLVSKTEGGTVLHEILSAQDDSSIGYILEVDLHYLERLHYLHSHFPLAPTKEEISFFWGSDNIRATRWNCRENHVSQKTGSNS